MQLINKKFQAYVVGSLLLFLAGCGNQAGGPPGGGFAASVVAAPVKKELIEEKISLVGTLMANETVDIKNQVAGVVKRIGFEEGQTVTAGQMLFMIDTRKLNATLAQTEANFGLAQTTFDRLSTLITAGAISQQKFDQAKSDLQVKKAEIDLIKAELADSVISAAFDGIVGERKVSAGQFVDQGTTLSYLIRSEPIKAEFRVPERFLGQLKNGQPIQVTVAAYPNKIFNGDVYFIDPQGAPESRTALIKAKLPNAEGKLRQGMFANLDLIVNVRSNALTIPEEALIARGDEVYVFAVDAENKAQMKPVKGGVRLAGTAEILEGLSAGENVIVEGYQKIGPGSPVKIKENTNETKL